MWPSEFRDYQSDDHDVEQNETTPWLRHTGWSRLFHNRPLGIIAATAKKPKPAWNEDYLLGQWHTLQLSDWMEQFLSRRNDFDTKVDDQELTQLFQSGIKIRNAAVLRYVIGSDRMWNS
ncbi:hypothetical protein BFJ63_vAg17804 [Fusarium oxysporum f. sp. narcissi]|uniref:Uncharacterized protein n=2 Tax=Fusarium oxysporum TaxID=5507 RepID=A0A4Q2V3B7_FUSOX|nr:hypothetical protein FOVG_17183 [Fusarium oxysporum f. sp. pisi HDV247]RYC79319.1 hypothetical protein BFJ63_vAg17804 [Fusarium oxysporum f. sp. narcissi]